MANTDKVTIPVDISLPNFDQAIKAEVDKLSRALKTEARRIATSASAGNFPEGRPTVAGKSDPFTISGRPGKEFEIIGKATTDVDVAGASIERFVGEVKEIKQEIAGTFAADAEQLKKFKATIKHQPLAVQEKEIQDFLLHNKDINNELKNRLQKIQQGKAKITFADIKTENVGKDLADQKKAFEDYLTAGGQLRNKANAEIRRINKQIIAQTKIANSATFSEIKVENVGKPLEDQKKAFQDYLAAGGKLQNKAKGEIRKLNAQLGNKTFSEIKLENVGKDLGEQRQAFADYLAAGGNLRNKANAEIRKIDNQILSKTKQEERSVETALRRRRNDARNAEITRQRNFANFTLVGSGVGLGLLGSVGFPLLNVGFSAMSGGVPGAVIVGFATALGESTRALERFTASAEAVARSIGFIPKSLKILEAQQQARDAFAGFGALNAREVGMRIRQSDRAGRGFDATRFQMSTAEAFQGFKEASRSAIEEEILGAGGFGRSVERNAGLAPLGFAIRALIAANRQDQGMNANRLPAMESALKEYRLGVLGGTVGLESDPYEVWKRMQNAALDPTKGAELEIMMKQLAELEKLVELERQRHPPVSGAGLSAGIGAAAAAAAAAASGSY